MLSELHQLFDVNVILNRMTDLSSRKTVNVNNKLRTLVNGAQRSTLTVEYLIT